tara:strand:+ start:203 stop:577 length:375 start_codon:yes stop_codon:yes gene_type:complete
MKQEYKYLIDLCNSYVAPLDQDGDFDFNWWTSSTGDTFETPKSMFVFQMIDLLSKKDKNFPEKEFLKQVQCKYKHNGLVDIVYKKQHQLEIKKKEREERKEEIKAEKERQKFIEEFGYYYGDVV